ncbi:MAG: hypothetical protein WC004_01345 [Candidatus Absconditabacterales bacterium]
MSTIFLLGNSEPVLDTGNIELTTNPTQVISTTYYDTTNQNQENNTGDSGSETQTGIVLHTGLQEEINTGVELTTGQEQAESYLQSGNDTQSSGVVVAEIVTYDATPINDAAVSPSTSGESISTGTKDVVHHTQQASVSNDVSYIPEIVQVPVDLLSILRAPRMRQYKPGAHVGNPEDSGYIMYSPSDLMPLAYEGLVAAAFPENSTGIKELFIGTDVFYRSYDNQIQVKLPEDLSIQTLDGKPFSTQEFDLESLEGREVVATIQKYDRNTDTYTTLDDIPVATSDGKEFHFGVSGEHLIFSKPLEVKIFSSAPNGTLVDIIANHANQGRTKDGLATDLSTHCDSGHATIPGSITTVQDNTITFYICGASTFALTYTGGANNDNMADGGFKDKAVEFLTGTHFPTGSTIDSLIIGIDRRPIDGRDPANPGAGTCAPGDVYFTLTHNTGGTSMILITSGQLTDPNGNCPRVYTNFTDNGTSPITGRYYTGSFRPTTGQALGIFNGQAPFGSWILRMGDTSNNSDAVILYGFTITIDASTGQSSSGYVCIHSPSFTTGTAYTSTSTTGIYEIDIGSFELEDPTMPYTGYYTTLTVAPPVYKAQTGITLSTGHMERKATAVVQLTGIPNTTVRIDTGRLTYTGVQEPPRVFILRNDGAGAGRVGRWQSNLRIRITMPPYMKPGYWASQITYTLYSN